MANATLSAPQPIQIHRPVPAPAVQGEWSVEAIQALLDKPLMDLLFEAQTVHRQHWPAGDIELATLLSVKTGGCPENCCLLYTSPSPRDQRGSRMPSSA